jgi:hypothetical protein
MPQRPDSGYAPWSQVALSKLNFLLRLPPGWDGYGAPMVSRHVARRVLRFLIGVVPVSVSMPDLVPRGDGLIQIEWHQGPFEIEITMRRDGFECLVIDGDDEIDFEFSDADVGGFRRMMSFLRRLD